MADGGVGGQLDRLRKQAALESARLDNINPNGGRYHGEETLNQLEETLSRATQATSNFLEGHWWGRNLKGNLSNWSQMAIGAASRMADYAEAESTRTPTNPGQALGFIAGNIGKSRKQYTDVATGAITDNIKINGQAIDPRITRAVVGETLDAISGASAGRLLRGAAKTLTKIPTIPTGGSLVPVGAGIYNIPYSKLDDGFKPSTVFKLTTSPELTAKEAYQGIAREPKWISRLAQQDKRVEKRKYGRNDPLDDARSFLHEPRFGRSFYGVRFDKLPLQMRKDAIALMNNTGEQVQWHHWNPKLHTSERNRRMIQLIHQGKADWDDYVNLHLMAEQLNAASGGGIGGLGAIHKSFHTDIHKWLRREGLEYTGKPREKIQARLAKLNTADELIIDLIQDIDYIVKPTKKEVRRAYRNIPDYTTP